ncbi:MAG: hypothetical protein V4714_20725 [Bacteroidota bacterium]
MKSICVLIGAFFPVFLVQAQQPDEQKLTWKLNLAAAETHTLDLRYTVQKPKGKTIDGF